MSHQASMPASVCIEEGQASSCVQSLKTQKDFPERLQLMIERQQQCSCPSSSLLIKERPSTEGAGSEWLRLMIR